MTVQTSEATPVATPSCHGSAGEDGSSPHAANATGSGANGAGAAALGTLVALPRNVKIIGGAVVGLGALLALGVPLATLTPLVFLGGCLGMHLFMGHGMSHGGVHASHDTNGGAASGSGSPEDASTHAGT